ncbi:molybdopterin-dependent oxidoreductase [Desulfotignum phosphitoxidans]|uniref:Molybdopterin oxidoreductase, molybdopterin binding subunit n=1 Tax=Desulfotignum phosphitoxidans DSM 13687 TaxID=1286635 RepID=S0G375_9BACT|nr:molybdopterin-dependent oxidoreductase [Desulfotignum phosphitoxidans]EMS78186.1 molybdopterin oxidoreductase, molybdopterin binding subunit [Desulfotignum phosphitoxidans DSM 13687]
MYASAVQNSVKSGKWINSTCKMCLHSCSVRVHVTDEGVVNKVEGNPTNPSNESGICPKGNSSLLRLYDPQRIKTPMKRTNPRKGPDDDPGWVPISWEEALDTVGRELKKTFEDDPRKLLPAINDFQKIYLWAWPAAFGGNANYFSVVGTQCGGGYHPMNGFIHSTFAAGNDTSYCNYWINNGGGDGFSSHLHMAGAARHMARARVDRGMHLVTVEPRLSISAAKSDEWVPIRPATDRHFALGLCHVLINEKLYDEAFLKKDTNAVYLVGPDGFFVRNEEGNIYVWDSVDNKAKLWNDETIKDYALEGEYEVEGVKASPAFQLFKDNISKCTPEKISQVTTVPAETIQRIAREFAKAASIGSSIKIDGKTLPFRPAAYNYYRGAQGHKTGSMTNHSFKLVNFLVGNIDTPGGHVGVTLDDFMIDRGHIWEGDCGQIKTTPHQLHPEVPFAYPPNTAHLMDYFPLGVDPGHLITQTFFDQKKWGMDFKPDTMLICHSNPLWNLNGPQEKYFDIMRNMRFIVAIDILLNESTQWADIVLPTLDNLERWNMVMIEPPLTEGQCLTQPAIEPLWDCKSEEEIFNEISERIGILDQWNEIQNYANMFFEKPELMLKPGKKYSDKEIAERKGKMWNDKDLDWYIEKGHSSTMRRPDKFYRPWEGQRIHFYIEDILTRKKELQENMKKANVPFYDIWEWDDYQAIPNAVLDPVHKEPEEYDMYAITFKDVQVNFGENLSIPWISDIVYKDPVHMGILINTLAAKKRGISDGDLIKVTSNYGTIMGLARVTEGMHVETVGVSNALSRWTGYHAVVKPAGGHYNRLLPADLKNTCANSGQMETAAKVKVELFRKNPNDDKIVESEIKNYRYARK